MSSILYVGAPALFAGGADWASKKQRFYAMLVGGSYTPNVRHKHVTQVIARITRQEIVGRSVEENPTGADFMARATVFAPTTSRSYRWIVVFRAGKTDATSDLIVAYDMGTVPLNGIKKHTIRWNNQMVHGKVFTLGPTSGP